ncbi:OmpA family protein [Serratia fonticola]|uniref:OmpA family protein n=1 Tax=Serratia fonticola TaxID=47917 RepID=UPI001868F257|nr:OmpA family protein [Serratia fonticola]
MKQKKIFACSLFAVFLFAVFFNSVSVYAYENSQNKKNSFPWEIDVLPTEKQWSSDVSRVSLVVFREMNNSDNLLSPPLNIFIDGQYHASLMSGRQSIALSLCPKNTGYSISIANPITGNVTSKILAKETTPPLPIGTISFYQIVMGEQGKISTKWVERTQALAILSNMKVQSHTISRVAKGDHCPDSTYSVNTSTLFKFGGYTLNQMLPGANRKLEQLVSKINADFMKINKIIIKGYADPIGNDEVNRNISESRAYTVVSQLITLGLSSDVISYQGMGDTNLIVDTCDSQHKDRKGIIDCNQPNRRVEIEVYGTKRN